MQNNFLNLLAVMLIYFQALAFPVKVLSKYIYIFIGILSLKRGL